MTLVRSRKKSSSEIQHHVSVEVYSSVVDAVGSSSRDGVLEQGHDACVSLAAGCLSTWCVSLCEGERERV